MNLRHPWLRILVLLAALALNWFVCLWTLARADLWMCLATGAATVVCLVLFFDAAARILDNNNKR